MKSHAFPSDYFTQVVLSGMLSKLHQVFMLKKDPSDSLSQTSSKAQLNSSKRQKAESISVQVGEKLRAIRRNRKLSIRALAELSELSVNTLSLIENRRTSPSVSTLNQLAQSLDVPITAFFEKDPRKKRVVYQKAGERQQVDFSLGQVESLGDGMPRMGSEPFITKLEPNANSGKEPIIYAGREFIYCLEGLITYSIEGESYPLSPGDSLIFDAYTPHSWANTSSTRSRALLVLCPEDLSEDASSPRFFFMP
jgi:transcriptional regulator with XRE-family HTH domain